MVNMDKLVLTNTSEKCYNTYKENTLCTNFMLRRLLIMLYNTFIHAENGNTETIVLLHGFGGNSRIWKYQIPLLSKYFNVLTVDLPSHNEGNLQLSQIDVTLDAISREILAVCDMHNVRNAVFMGVSLGTVFVKYIEAFYPEYVKFGILVGAVATVNALLNGCAKLFSKIGDKLPFAAVYHVFSWIIMPGKRNQESRSIFRKCAIALNKKEFKLYMHIFNQAFRFSKMFEKEYHPENTYISGMLDSCFLRRTILEAQRSCGRMIQMVSCGHVCNIVHKNRFNKIMLELLDQNQTIAAD